MNIDEWNEQRTFCIAQMAATLEAGDRANSEHYNYTPMLPIEYAAQAAKLFDAVELIEAERLGEAAARRQK